MIEKPINLKRDWDDNVTAALMVQTNALIPMKIATRLCGISRQEIDRCIQEGTFPKPCKLSADSKSLRKAFHLNDLQEWINNPADYRQPEP